MNMRISKYEPYGGIGADIHAALPPCQLLPPPFPPDPKPQPVNSYIVIIAYGFSALLTGKWSDKSIKTEEMKDILWQYDWGPLQMHLPFGPVFGYGTPSVVICSLGSTAKYFLPSFAIQEKIGGGELALRAKGDAPVAVSFPTFSIPLENCHDISLLGFVFPSSLSFQSISTRWVGFNEGDFFAGVFGLAGDALAAAILSTFGGKLLPGQWDDQLLVGVASTFMLYVYNALVAEPVDFGLMAFLGLFVSEESLIKLNFYLRSNVIKKGGGLALLAPFIAKAGTWFGQEVGEEWGSGDDDWGWIVSFKAGANGSISGDTKQHVQNGNVCSPVTAFADQYYKFTGWSGDYAGTSDENPLTIPNVTSNMTITASFEPISYTVTFKAGANGSITGPTTQNVQHGNDCSPVTAVADQYSKFTGWYRDNVLISDKHLLTLYNVTFDVTITAKFTTDRE